ncbi:hypothetical protein [Streptomyces sp. KR80]|uniref:hypothetical protein n=1 Tax=Streptomyces sp. KR80 TaxID=3457426 RepID=UPI003FD3B1C3
MRSLNRVSRSDRTKPAPADPDLEPQGVEGTDQNHEDGTDETYEMFRVICPDCTRPIALLADEDVLPEHAEIRSPWNPFGLTVCLGTGRTVAETTPADATRDAQEQDAALLLTLPEGLDWRRQPFSHVGGPGSRPIRMPRARRHAA